MPTGVIDEVLDATSVALRDMPAHRGRTTGGEIRHGTPMASRHRGAETRHVRRAKLPHGRRHGHARVPHHHTRLQGGHQGIHRGRERARDGGRDVRVHGRRRRAAMAQQLLNGAQMDATLQQVRRIRMA